MVDQIPPYYGNSNSVVGFLSADMNELVNNINNPLYKIISYILINGCLLILFILCMYKI